MSARLVAAVRVLMGLDYLINGANWWFKIIAPYPSLSDFVTHPPPPGIVGALIQTGFMFHIVKATELLTGVALLTDRFVPLMLVVVFPVTLSVFLADVFLISTLRGYLMGGGALIMNSFLILAYLNAYAPLLQARCAPDALSALPEVGVFARVLRRFLTVHALLAATVGFVMVTWIAVMVVQYLRHPMPFGAR